MKFELSNSQIKELVGWLKQKINNNEYTIIRREKNNRFLTKYRLDNSLVKEKVLLKISENNYISEEFDYETLKYGTEKVAKFIVECKLIDFHGEESIVNVYVKIKENIDCLATISIHESEK